MPEPLLLADWDHDGRVDARPPADPAEAFAVVPLVPEGREEVAPGVAAVRLRRPVGETREFIVGVEGPAAFRARLYLRGSAGGWAYRRLPPGTNRPERPGRVATLNVRTTAPGLDEIEVGVAAVPGSGADAATLPNDFTLTLRFDPNQEPPAVELRCRVAPLLLTSALDPVQELFVVRNPLTEKFADALARLAPRLDGRPKLRFLSNDPAHASDIWAQDTMEVARTAHPEGKNTAREVSAPLLGLRAKHDMGLTCGPLDALVAEMWRKDPAAVPVQPGEPRGGARWIDWYGNLEVSPPVPGFPFGRVLYGEQKGLAPHPGLLALLEAQRVQWPPVVIDVSWLTIGHVDEAVNFVPGPKGERGPGFRALVPSPKAARDVLERLVKDGHGKAAVFPGRKKETTVEKLLETVARSEESRRVEEAVGEARARLREGLKLTDEQIVALPVLFEGGLSVTPNAVNCLVVGRDLVIPAPCGPVVNGRDAFEAATDAVLKPLGVRTHFLDAFEPYHARSGEIHCGTNAVRRLPHGGRWWEFA